MTEVLEDIKKTIMEDDRDDESRDADDHQSNGVSDAR